MVSLLYFLQAVFALFAAGVLNYFHARHRRPFVRLWIWGWLALVVHLAVQAAYRDVEMEGGANGWRFPMTLMCVTAGLAAAAALAAGAYESGAEKKIPRRTALTLLAALPLAGLLFALSALFAPGLMRLAGDAGAGLVALPVGLTLLGAGLGFWAGAPRTGLGRKLLSTLFTLLGLLRLAGFVVRLAAPEDGETRLLLSSTWLAAVDSLLLPALAMAMVIWLLEEERREAALAASQVEKLAYHDALTGLPNRQLFFDRLSLALAQERRRGGRLAVFYLDLDHFKVINDSLGHSVGDALLKAVAGRLRTGMRETDSIARLGGDEFIGLTAGVETRAEVLALAEKLRLLLHEPFRLDGQTLNISASLGVSLMPEDGLDAETLLKNADSAMYRAKEKGRNRCEFYKPEMGQKDHDRLSLETGLRLALERDEFILFYQPQIRIADGLIDGFEALIRWQHPDRGLIGPDDFLRVAEVAGLSDALDDWVLRTACRQARAWRALGFPNLRMAVNLGAATYQRSGLVARVRGVLEAAGLPPGALELDITESTALQNVEASIAVLKELRQLGVQVSIDDFGTGYSSLSYLRRLPIDTLKIDQSFVRELPLNPADAAIAAAIIAMARSLGIRVTAEGVETEAQLQILRLHQCDLVQGYLFSRPATVEACERLLKQEGPSGYDALYAMLTHQPGPERK